MRNYWVRRFARDIIQETYTNSKHIVRWKEDIESVLEEICPTGDAVLVVTPQEAYSAGYWRCRAARIRSLASRHDGKLQDRLANIASSYDLLAERAQRVGEQINEIEAIDND